MANGHTEHGKALLYLSSQDVPHNHLLLALIDFNATKAQDISGQGKFTGTAGYQHKRSVTTSGKSWLGSWWKERRKQLFFAYFSWASIVYKYLTQTMPPTLHDHPRDKVIKLPCRDWCLIKGQTKLHLETSATCSCSFLCQKAAIECGSHCGLYHFS